jgi:hypothetical protein
MLRAAASIRKFEVVSRLIALAGCTGAIALGRVARAGVLACWIDHDEPDRT